MPGFPSALIFRRHSFIVPFGANSVKQGIEYLLGTPRAEEYRLRKSFVISTRTM
jgi:hypothetical protein